jgi:hypothetical protein
VGPSENFSGKISHLEVERDAPFGKNGDLLFTDIKLSIDPAETEILRVLIRANPNQNYYTTPGLADFYLRGADAVTFSQFKKENSKRIASVKNTPIEIGDRVLSSINFNP